MKTQQHSPTIDVATAGTTTAVAARICTSSVKMRTTQCRARKVDVPSRHVLTSTMQAATLCKHKHNAADQQDSYGQVTPTVAP